MNEYTKNRWQNRRRHEAYGGDISGTFCGREFKGIRTIGLDARMGNPIRVGKDNPAR